MISKYYPIMPTESSSILTERDTFFFPLRFAFCMCSLMVITVKVVSVRPCRLQFEFLGLRKETAKLSLTFAGPKISPFQQLYSTERLHLSHSCCPNVMTKHGFGSLFRHRCFSHK